MIHQLRLRNFKRFEDLLLGIKPLTLLSGLNGMGKSSILQALLLLRQSYHRGLLESIGLSLNGDLVRIGTARDALFENATEDRISFQLDFGDANRAVWEFDYDSDREILKLVSPNKLPEVYTESLFTDEFQYLQAERIGSRSSFGMSDFQVREHYQLGIMGEYTAHFLSVFREFEIPNPNLSHHQSESLQLLRQVEAWLGEISPGTRIYVEENLGMDLMRVEYSFGLSKKYRSTNVGFGITYTLPVITAILAAKAGALLLLENPEAHLHPKGQAQMGQLIALAASQGVQIILETHSDHVLNGIRLAVHQGKLDPELVQLHFFQRQSATSEVISPKMNRKGRIDQWPDGFFDEWDNSLAELLQPVEE